MKTRFLTPLLLFLATLAAAQIKIREVNADVINARLEHFAKNIDERQELVKKMFAEAGCRGERLQVQEVKKSRFGNVICTLPGSGDTTILVGAHYDSVKAGDGVVDNWSGVSLLPSLYESLSTMPRQHTYVFVAFTDEELGLFGSDFYAAQLTAEQRTKMQAMVNIDSMGLGPTKLWVSHSDPRLVSLIAKVAGALKLPVGGANVEKVGSTDSESFAKWKIPVLAIHSVTTATLHMLHSPRDNLTSIKRPDYYDSYRLMAVFLAYLDGKLPLQEPPKPAK